MTTTLFDKGVQFGGNDGMQIQHGGAIRQSFPVNATAQFREGYCIELNDSGELQKSTAETTMMAGMSYTRRVLNDFNNDQTIGSSDAAMIVDPAVITVPSTACASGIEFHLNDPIYQNENGLWTNVNPSTDHRIYGSAQNHANANAGDSLLMYYKGAQAPTA